MRNPYCQSLSNDQTLRAHACTLFSALWLQRWASGGDVAPSDQGSIDDAVRKLRTDSGVSMKDFLERGNTMAEAERAFEAVSFAGRLPPTMRVMHGGSVRADILPELQDGNYASVAVNYGVIQDAHRGVGSFRGGHNVVVGEPDNGQLWVADPLRTVPVKWSIDLLEHSMETFGKRPWGNGRGEAGVVYPSPTYKAAYTDARADLVAARAGLVKTQRQRDDARGDLSTAQGVATDLRSQLTTAAERIRALELLKDPDCGVSVGNERARLVDAIVAFVEGQR